MLFGIAALAAVIVAATHFSEARDFARLTEHAQPWWLTLAIILQAGTYLAQAQVLCAVARAGRSGLGLLTAARLGLAKLFTEQALPSAGLSGTLVLAAGLERRGLPRPVVAAALVVDLASFYVAYVLCLAVALVITAVHGEQSTVILLVSLVFMLFGVGLTIMVLALSGRGARAVPRRLRRLSPVRAAIGFLENADRRLSRDPRLLLEATAYQLAIVLCDSATMWVLIHSLGGHGSVSGVFASFMSSSLLRTVGLMPGGLGTFEAASVLTLSMVGVPTAVALAATLLFRGLSFWLPMIPGLWFSRHEVRPTRRSFRPSPRTRAPAVPPVRP